MAKQAQKKSPSSRTLPSKEKKIESNVAKNNDSNEEIITKQGSGAKPIKEQPMAEYQLYSDLKMSNSNINYSELYRVLISDTGTVISLVIHTKNLSEDNIALIIKDILPKQSKKVCFNVTISSCVDDSVVYKNKYDY